MCHVALLLNICLYVALVMPLVLSELLQGDVYLGCLICVSCLLSSQGAVLRLVVNENRKII